MEVSGQKFIDPNPYKTYQAEFTKWMQRIGYAMTTIEGYERQLQTFFEWLNDNRIKELNQINQSNLEAYNKYLHEKKNKQKQGGLSSCYIQSHINVIRLLSKYLELTGEQKIFTGNIIVEQGTQTPRTILTQTEIKQLYQATDESPNGLRDKAILSLYYGCGLRYSEGIRVERRHIDYGKQFLYVVPGKNYRSRFIPMNEKIIKDLQDYEVYGRPYFMRDESKYFLLNLKGNPPDSGLIGKRLKYLLQKAGIEKDICLHGLRHSIATHLLQQGMPLEQISKFLGHTSLDSTQIYTRIAEELND
ncbi:tyrosine-type recombinase/integrase [Xanthomarina sp.]|uniref:tyrosine-type recombinase/integrase n=1 Tax=Xanthomarina sp. TaxID=1931211 RepID=UPI002C411214|nr:tyrosine-type recombinase/integrase [Xanthomarina sp.]HLV39845.1 tyrosine-type recombinase/integrase [Xanthomarina sp.]